MKKICVGLLPLYIKLYDDKVPQMRPRLERFYEKIACALEARGLEVLRAPFCRLEGELKAAVEGFEAKGAEALVTLHMAYSPSLESAAVLKATELPIVVLDTTETFAFGKDQDPGEISYCHGIHGVMDMCSLLIRNGKVFEIAAGHDEKSDVLDRTVGLVKAACAAKALKGSRVGVFGGDFPGMGDFAVTAEELMDNFGVTLVKPDAEEIRALGARLTGAEIAAEKALDAEKFDGVEKITPMLYEENLKACLTLRKWVEKEKLDAFSVTFLGITPENGLGSMPFMEACKAMEKGIGYAGEGDALTAAFSGALLKVFPESSFVEIFCPDWENNTLLISHMGEMNYLLADEKPVMQEAKTNYTPSFMPVVGYARFKAGPAVYMNVCRDEKGFKLVAAKVEMLDCKNDAFTGSMRGWFKPECGDIAKFLEEHSRHGATHHSLLSYGMSLQQAVFFGKVLGLRVEII